MVISFLQVLEVCSPPGTLVAVVEEVQNSLATEIDIKNVNGDVILKIEGPITPLFNRSFWLRDIVFEVPTPSMYMYNVSLHVFLSFI